MNTLKIRKQNSRPQCRGLLTACAWEAVEELLKRIPERPPEQSFL